MGPTFSRKHEIDILQFQLKELKQFQLKELKQFKPFHLQSKELKHLKSPFQLREFPYPSTYRLPAFPQSPALGLGFEQFWSRGKSAVQEFHTKKF